MCFWALHYKTHPVSNRQMDLLSFQIISSSLTTRCPLMNANERNSWRQFEQSSKVYPRASKHSDAVRRFYREKIVFFILIANTTSDWVISFPRGMTTLISIILPCRQFLWVTGANSQQVDGNESVNQGWILHFKMTLICHC